MTRLELARTLTHTLPRMGHLAPILDAAATCGIAVGWLTQSARPIDAPLIGRGAVTIVGDDPMPPRGSLGPAGFHQRSLRMVLRESHMVAILSGEVAPDVYTTAATAAAAMSLHVTLIETRVRHEGDWLSLVKKLAPNAALLVVTPPAAGNA